MQAAVRAAVQALVGGGIHQALAIWFVQNSHAVNISRNKPLISAVPSISAIMTHINATNFNSEPQGLWIHGVKQNLCDACGPHVDC